MMRDKPSAVGPVFRRSLFGYSASDVDRFLNDSAADRDRLRDALTRVESLMGQWQCANDAAKTLETAEGDTPRIAKPAGRRSEAVVPRWEAPLTLEPKNGPLAGPDSVAREPMTAIKALELSRSNRRRQRRRIAGLVAACAAIAAITTFEFRTGKPMA